MKRAIVILLSVMMLFSLAACGSAGESEGFTVDTVTMTYVKSPLNVPSIVEKARGSFEEAYAELGLGFAYSDLTSGADQTAALASGSIQILNAVGGTSVILSAANGADIRILSMYSTSPKAFRLFSAKDDVNSPEDLRGLTIGGPKGTNLHELLAAYLASGGMTMEDVDFISMDIPSAMAGLENGSIDCALLAGPTAYQCEKAGHHLVTDGEGLISGAILTAATQEFCDSNQEVIDTFLDVQKETLDYIKENHDEAMQLAAEETGLEPEAAAEMFELYDFRTEITEEDIAALENTAAFMLESGLIENEGDIPALLLKK